MSQGGRARRDPPRPAARRAAGRPAGDAARPAGPAAAPPDPGPQPDPAPGPDHAVRPQRREGVRHRRPACRTPTPCRTRSPTTSPAQNLPSELVMSPHPELQAIPWSDRPLLQIREGRAEADRPGQRAARLRRHRRDRHADVPERAGAPDHDQPAARHRDRRAARLPRRRPLRGRLGPAAAAEHRAASCRAT